mgnify:CR=1 FL=1
MLKLRHVLRYFTEGNSEKNKQRGSKSIKIIIFKQPNSSLHSLKKQQLRVVSLQRYRGVNMCVFSTLIEHRLPKRL